MHNIQRNFVYYTLFLVVALSYSCHSSKHARRTSDKMPGVWQAQPIAIDGDCKDWPSPYPNYDSKGMIAYATSNDDQYLYITMQTGDELTQLKIIQAGMVVSIDTNGSKDQTFKINYPLPDQSGEPLDLPKPDKSQKPETVVLQLDKQIKQHVKKGMEAANQLTIEGFSNCNGGYVISQTTPCGIKVKASIDEYKELVWEAAIPFSAIYNKSVITAADAGKPISVCFAIKGMKKPKSSETDNNTSGSGMGGSGMGRASGGGNMGRGGGSARGGVTQNPLSHLYETTKTWKFFVIAYH